MHYLCEDSGTSVLFVEDDEQLDKALEVRGQLPLIKKIIVFDMEGLRDLDDPGVMSMAALRELGRRFHAEQPQALAQRVAACTPGCSGGRPGRHLAHQTHQTHLAGP